MLTALVNSLIAVIQSTCVIAVLAYAIIQTQIYRKMIDQQQTVQSQAVLIAIFSLFSVYAALAAIPIAGGLVALAHTGQIVAGLLAGPVVGTGVGLAMAVYRIALGGALIVPSSLSALLAGVLAGLYSSYKRNSTITVASAVWFTIAFEVIARFISLALSPDFPQALERNMYITLPMVFGHAAAVGVFIYIVNSISKNITKRKQADEALRQSEQLFHKAFYNGGALMIIIRITDGKIIEVNKYAMDLLEYSQDEILGHTDSEINLFVEDEGIESMRQTLISTGELANYEVRLRTKSGRILPLLSSYTLIHINGELCEIIIAQDLTQQKILEAELQRLDRLNLVGEMAASIGHEIRNPMTTVRGYLQLFQRRLAFADYGEQLTTMIEELDRANAIITEFLSLAKNKVIELQPGNLNTIVSTLFPLIQADTFLMGHDVIVELGDIPDNQFDPQEVRQLILNLTRNALEAMETSGLLTIKTYCNADAIVLEVQDTGPGIPCHILKEVGKPFVTTKENGTGLGLPVCYRIAERHGAELEINSSPQGTIGSVKFKR